MISEEQGDGKPSPPPVPSVAFFSGIVMDARISFGDPVAKEETFEWKIKIQPSSFNLPAAGGQFPKG
jgi:hypothetical protein